MANEIFTLLDIYIELISIKSEITALKEFVHKKETEATKRIGLPKSEEVLPREFVICCLLQEINDVLKIHVTGDGLSKNRVAANTVKQILDQLEKSNIKFSYVNQDETQRNPN